MIRPGFGNGTIQAYLSAATRETLLRVSPRERQACGEGTKVQVKYFGPARGDVNLGVWSRGPRLPAVTRQSPSPGGTGPPSAAIKKAVKPTRLKSRTEES